MPITTKKQLEKLLSHEYWKKDQVCTYRDLKGLLFVTLGISDRRVVSKWIGRRKPEWQERVRGSGLYAQKVKEKVWVWESGILQDMGYVIPYIESIKGDQILIDAEKTPKGTIMFKILKGGEKTE